MDGNISSSPVDSQTRDALRRLYGAELLFQAVWGLEREVKAGQWIVDEAIYFCSSGKYKYLFL